MLSIYLYRLNRFLDIKHSNRIFKNIENYSKSKLNRILLKR